MNRMQLRLRALDVISTNKGILVICQSWLYTILGGLDLEFIGSDVMWPRKEIRFLSM